MIDSRRTMVVNTLYAPGRDDPREGCLVAAEVVDDDGERRRDDRRGEHRHEHAEKEAGEGLQHGAVPALTCVSYSAILVAFALPRDDGTVFSVELVLEDAAELAVRDDWARLIEAGLPSSGRNLAPTNRPHITVAVRDDIRPRSLDGLAAALPLRIELSGLLIFGGAARSVLTRHVVASAALLELHREVARRLGPPGARYSNTAPDRWSPHVTLARGLDAEQLARAVRAIAAPFTGGEATGLRLWDASAKTATALD